ncbi:hypothetical protein CASFOL_012742 [Castilleja foliolosa]|uniref:RING-type E3 ubiquitin transferase n=1 Tax=Castilleja foliolosa TaxID=1961234 RepID=A0ABD3DLB1_9LAMI
MDPQLLVKPPPAGSNVDYAFDGHMLIFSGIATFLLILVLLASLHLYARWWLISREAAAQRTNVVALAADNHNPGLEPAVLSSLPVFIYSSKSTAELPESSESERPMLECAVCLSEFEEDETVRLLPKCNHAFHIECIDMWFHSHSTCPLCRSPVEPVVNRIEPGSSSGWRNAMDVKIDVSSVNEFSQSSPSITRLLSFKRLLSMGRKSPVETSRVATELDLEDGLGEPIRMDTPK